MDLKARIAGEKRIARMAVDKLLLAGFELAIWNGGEEPEVAKTGNVAKLRKGLGATDEDVIIAYRDGKRIGSAQLVYGNSPWELIADYSLTLEDWLGEGTDVDQAARKIEAREYGTKFVPGAPCQIFAACTHEATEKVTHPVLGEIDACKRCVHKMERIEKGGN